MLTTTNGAPYPENADPISSYPDTIKALAQKIDAGGQVFRTQAAGVSAATTAFARIPFDAMTPPDDTGRDLPMQGLTLDAAGVFTVTTPGLWHIEAATGVSVPASPAAGARVVTMLRLSRSGQIGVVTGAAGEYRRETRTATASTIVVPQLTCTVRLNLGAQFDILHWQSTGSTLTVRTGPTDTWIAAYRVGP